MLKARGLGQTRKDSPLLGGNLSPAPCRWHLQVAYLICQFSNYFFILRYETQFSFIFQQVSIFQLKMLIQELLLIYPSTSMFYVCFMGCLYKTGNQLHMKKTAISFYWNVIESKAKVAHG